MQSCRLVRPSLGLLPAYKAALESGWSPSSLTPKKTAIEQLQAIEQNGGHFVQRLRVSSPHAEPKTGIDGRRTRRLPGYTRWLWAGQFCGSINLRWQPGTTALPSHILGHIGFSVVPWLRNRGHAKRALALILLEARVLGLSFVELATDPDNLPSQRVILANGGHLTERFLKSALYGGNEALRFQISLQGAHERQR